MRARAAFLLLLSALAMPVVAGNVYRCDAGNGITSYSNKRVSGASCKLVGSYKAARASTRASQPKVAPYAPPPVVASATPPAAAAASTAPARVSPARNTSYSAPRLVRGQVYAYVGKDGVRNYTSVRPRGMSGGALRTIKYSYMETCYACGAKPG